MFFNSTEGAHDFRDLCKYGYVPSGKKKRVQPHGSHLILTLEQTNKQTNRQTNKQKTNRILTKKAAIV